jgi:hypothetical protein
MLKIPTENYTSPLGSTRYLEVVVDLTDEGAPRLSLEIDPSEIVAPVREFVEPTFEHADQAHDPDLDPRILRLEEQNAELRTYRDALQERNAYLEDRLADARCSRTLDRELLPDEARAIAAALWHYAGEADAFGRRP